MLNKLYVGNLPYSLNQQTLEELFSSCGEVINVHIPKDKTSQRPRGFAFVEMSSPEELQEAISKLNGANVGGRDLIVTVAREKDPHTRKSYAKELGTGECILCHTVGDLFGIESDEAYSSGVCSSCIISLSKIIRPPKPSGIPGPLNRY